MDGIAAVEQITRNCYRSFGALRGAELIDDGRLFGVMSRMPIAFFSGIASSNIEEADVPGVIEWFRERQGPFRWWITPSTRPTNLEEILIANGLKHAYDAPGMVADLTKLDLDAPPPVEIRRLTHADELLHWQTVFMAVFKRAANEAELWVDAFAQLGFEQWQHFVAFIDGEPVATASVLTEGELAGIYNVGTLASARGRGIGAAATREAMRWARDHGATQAALQSSELGLGVYRALGFVQSCDLRLYQDRLLNPERSEGST
jgi:GNAT superfamily N-acetyltransferase